ncbi:DUF6773 family protein [Candidatus Latescibacterota bacterium]
MIVDERIKAVRNRAAAGSFIILYCFLLIDLLYRQFYLKQEPGDYWDIILIWFASSLYFGITAYSSGMMSGKGKVGQQFKIIIPCVIVSALVTSYFRGRITSMHDFAEIMLSLVVMVPVLFSVFLFYNYLNRRWEKKNELEE